MPSSSQTVQRQRGLSMKGRGKPSVRVRWRGWLQAGGTPCCRGVSLLRTRGRYTAMASTRQGFEMVCWQKSTVWFCGNYCTVVSGELTMHWSRIHKSVFLCYNTGLAYTVTFLNWIIYEITYILVQQLWEDIFRNCFCVYHLSTQCYMEAQTKIIA